MSDEMERTDNEVEVVEEPPDNVVYIDVKEPMIHQVGRQALGFAMAFVAERLSNVAYDGLLKLYRMRKGKV
jgi:hypothetical protein